MPIKRQFFAKASAPRADNAAATPYKDKDYQQHPERFFEQLASGQLTLAAITADIGSNIEANTGATATLAPRSKWQRLIGLPAYYWVLLAQLFVILPHLAYLPAWLIGFGMLSIIAQLPSLKAKRIAHRRVYQLVQIAGFFGGLVGLWLTYGLNFGVDVGVAFLVLCLIGKLWELYKRRDAYVILNLSMFVLAALFLMDQGLTTTLQVLLGTSVTLLAFIAMNDDGNLQGSGRLRSFALLAGSALPLMIVLFLFFPRLPPLWSLQLSGAQATTGMSDSMSPGDIANLSQSTALAFRVEFKGSIPAQSELYWRGLVFSNFDGTTWTPSEQQQLWHGGPAPDWMSQALKTLPAAQRGSPNRYEIALEPTQARWLYGLDYPFTEQEGVAITSVFTLLRRDPVAQRLRYQAIQFPSMRIDTQLSDPERQQNLTLPKKGNQKTYQYAQALFAKSGNDPVRYINAVRQWINTDNFHYTLSPPPLQNERIDAFLFGTKAGFCEHYSSSFTYLMRAAGIPARVVAGYQGGKLGRDGKSWEVRQMDAHAWSEVWLQGQGWVRVDPTAFVAPERVEQGMDALTQQQGAAMFGTGATAQLTYQQFKMLQRLRRLTDQASYFWQRDIVGFDQDKQASSLLKWFNIKTILQQVLWMAIGSALIMTLIITFIWYRRRQQWHPADLPIVQLSKRMAKANPQLAIGPDEGILAWLERLEQSSASVNMQQAEAILQLKADYRRLRYGKQSLLALESADYQLAVKQLRAHAALIK